MLLYFKNYEAIPKAAKALFYQAPIVFYKEAKDIGVLGELVIFLFQNVYYNTEQ
jgi:hypothetical protein